MVYIPQPLESMFFFFIVYLLFPFYPIEKKSYGEGFTYPVASPEYAPGYDRMMRINEEQ